MRVKVNYMKNVEDAVAINFYIPPMPQPGRHHVISRGQNPDFYRPEVLRDKGLGKTAWVDAFEKILMGLYWLLDAPVPYAFRTPDGSVRSLDAGCIKMLLNRITPEVELLCDVNGYIEAVRPAAAMIERYEPIKGKLMKRIIDAGPG
jgi:hypothetical protein